MKIKKTYCIDPPEISGAGLAPEYEPIFEAGIYEYGYGEGDDAGWDCVEALTMEEAILEFGKKHWDMDLRLSPIPIPKSDG